MKKEQVLYIAERQPVLVTNGNGSATLACSALYTDTGNRNDWGIAIRIMILGDKVPKAVKVSVELKEGVHERN